MEKTETTIEKIKQRSFQTPARANWMRVTVYADGSRSWSYYRLKRDAVASDRQIGETRWNR